MRMYRVLGSMIVGALTAAACSSGDTTQDAAVVDSPSRTRPVVLDYSPTVSDATALLYLTQHPDVELLAVTLAGTGEARCDAAIPITRELLELGGLGDVPVACGQDEPIGPGNTWPDAWRARSEALLGLETAIPDGSADAADVLAEVAAAAGEPITIVAVGPLTNLAVALRDHPDLVENVAMVYSMGGAVEVEGNAPNGDAEWNYYVDPTAVDVVVRSGLPFTMVPLDATNDVPSTKEWFDLIARHHTTSAATAVYDLYAATRPFDSGFSFWDELAAATALDESFVTIEERAIVAEVEGGAQGQTRLDSEGTTVRVAVAADRDRFEQHLLTTLNSGVAAPAGTEADTSVAEPEAVAYFDALAASAATLDAGVSALFATPLAMEVETVFDDNPPAELDADQIELARRFMREFWTHGLDLISVHRDEVNDLLAPDGVQSEHDDYVEALTALTAARDRLVAEADNAADADVMDLLWQGNPEIEAVDGACSALVDAATERGLAVRITLCGDE